MPAVKAPEGWRSQDLADFKQRCQAFRPPIRCPAVKPVFALGLGMLAVSPSRLPGCDLCAVYNANAARGEGTTGFHLALAEQYTHSGTLQQDGREISDPIGQYRDSSITSLVLGYNFNSRWGLSLNLPYIHRSFRRAEGFAVDRGTESGLGDMALVGTWMPLLRAEHDFSYSVSLLGGVEFPTGDASRLSEEVNETEVPGAPPSGVHGDDLALGSGSFDGVVGISGNARWRRVMFELNAQYFIRSTGEFDYRFGNELSRVFSTQTQSDALKVNLGMDS